MKNIILFIGVCIMALSACSKKGVNKQYSYEGDSYLPMEVGNYWRTNDENYIKITDTKMIDNGLFYEFSSRIGGDVFGKNYYRIDKDNNLIEKFPDHPGSVYTHAKFGAKVGDVFYTTGKKDWNDLYVKITYKGDEQITFEYDMINHPNLKGQKSYRSFKRGFGFAQNWKEVKIGDKVYKF